MRSVALHRFHSVVLSAALAYSGQETVAYGQRDAAQGIAGSAELTPPAAAPAAPFVTVGMPPSAPVARPSPSAAAAPAVAPAMLPVAEPLRLSRTLPPTAPRVTLGPSVARPRRSSSLGPSEPLGRGLSVGLMLGMYVGMNTLAYLAWWKDSPPDQFEWIHDRWFERDTYAGGADKLGHFWGNILMTRAAAGILEEGGWHPSTSSYAGAALAIGTFHVVELRDAFSTGFSVNDTIANVAGAATGVLMREIPVLDRMFDFRVEYFPTGLYFKKFKKKGFNFTEDYTGMTFLFAYHLCSIPWVERSAGILRFADVVLGYNARNYKPKPDNLYEMRYQDRFVGVSLNLQRIIDELWMGERHPKWGDSAGRAHRFTHFATEFLNLPFTSVQVGTWTTEYQKQPTK